MEIKIAQIKISADRREVDMNAVNQLAESIRELGLINPIVVDTEYNLIAGLHRIRAFEVLGFTSIKCTVVDFDALRAKLLEIDENFVRSPLTEWEKCEVLSRRKKIYEELHPETKHGGDRKSEKIKKAERLLDSEPPKSFTKDTAEKLGISETAVARRVRVAEKVTPEAKKVLEGEKSKFNLTEGLKLARIDPEQQEEAARQYVAGDIRTISDYRPQETPQADQGQQNQAQAVIPDNQLQADIRPIKPKGTKKKSPKGAAAENPAGADNPVTSPHPALTVLKPPPATSLPEGDTMRGTVDKQEDTLPGHAEKPQRKSSPPPRSPAPIVPSAKDTDRAGDGRKTEARPKAESRMEDEKSPDQLSKEEAKKALAASYKDPIIGKIVADIKDADMERPLTTEIFVGDFECAVNALIKRIQWFDIQEYQDIFSEVTEEQFQMLREIEKRAYSCLDNFMNNVKEKMKA